MKKAGRLWRCPRCHQEYQSLAGTLDLGCIGAGPTAHTEVAMHPVDPQSDPQTKESKR